MNDVVSEDLRVVSSVTVRFIWRTSRLRATLKPLI